MAQLARDVALGCHRPKKQNEQRPQDSSFSAQQRDLPIYHARKDLLTEIKGNPTVIVVGETGSGKTTQVPQFLHLEGYTRRGMVACTQPRRVAAVTVAQRVAMEMRTTVGDLVGYNIRFDEKTSANTKIKYLTDGMMLREAISDRLLRRYSVVILDEAHERTLHTDVLFALVKSIQKQRSDLKIIIMSATLEAQQFSEYFGGAKMLYIAGRQYPVQVMYTKSPQQDYLDAALVTIVQIHRSHPPEGDVLVFLTGQDEIESLLSILKDCNDTRPEGTAPLSPVGLYGMLPPHEQLAVFQPAPPGTRKVILATNIAETSVTINGIRFVVDTGVVKVRTYNPVTGFEVLAVRAASKAQVMQRTGRAGREGPGICYRVYTEAAFSDLEDSSEPEIQRCNLSAVVLHLMALGITNVVDFDYMSPPTAEALTAALSGLFDLGAINEDGELTTLGKKMAHFPLDPKLARVILLSEKYQCGEEILSIVSLLSVENPFFVPHAMKDKAMKEHRKFVSSVGDHDMMLNVFKAYQKTKGSKEWCYSNFINVRAMKTCEDTRKQLQELCVRHKVEIKSCGEDSSVFRRCLLSGLFSNTGVLQPDGLYKILKTNETAAIHPTSALFHTKTSCLLFTELVKTTKRYLRYCSVLDPEWLLTEAPGYFSRVH